MKSPLCPLCSDIFLKTVSIITNPSSSKSEAGAYLQWKEGEKQLLSVVVCNVFWDTGSSGTSFDHYYFGTPCRSPCQLKPTSRYFTFFSKWKKRLLALKWHVTSGKMYFGHFGIFCIRPRLFSVDPVWSRCRVD